MHAALILKNYYIPDLSSSIISSDYLLNVALGRCLRIQIDKIKIDQLFKKVSKIKLFYELEKVCQEKQFNLGMQAEKLPDKKWLINVLHTLDSGNQIFKNICESDKVIGLTQDDINILKQLDTSLGRKKSLKFFKRTPSQIAERKLCQANKKLINITTRLKKKKMESEKIEQKIRHYQIKLSSSQNFPLPQSQNEQQYIKKQQALK